MPNNHAATLSETLRRLTVQDFEALGLNHVAYIRPVLVMNRLGYALHAADGTPLSVLESEQAAVIAARAEDLEPVRLH